jgi:hypothetical protein
MLLSDGDLSRWRRRLLEIGCQHAHSCTDVDAQRTGISALAARTANEPCREVRG